MNFPSSGLLDDFDFPMIDLSGILPETASPSWKQMQIAPSEPVVRKPRLHFESSRAGGTFSAWNMSNWDMDKLERFKAWRHAPDQHSRENSEMAQEIADHLLTLFGGTAPDAIVTSPPRGKTAPDAPHAASLLAERVAELACIEYAPLLERNEADTTAHLARSRFTNLADTSSFRCTRFLDTLCIVIDDVSTTGSTLTRCRTALHSFPSLLFAYVIWH